MNTAPPQNALVETHPATVAWRRLRTDAPPPLRVDSVKNARPGIGKVKKSYVARLVAAGPGGTHVIAKRCRMETAAVERVVYEEILPDLPLPALDYYGCVEEPEGRYAWIFLQEASGAVWDKKDPDHRVQVATWLGWMHGAAARVATAADLPNRSTDHYLGQLHTAYGALTDAVEHPHLVDHIQLLKDLTSQLDHIQGVWPDLEVMSAATPQTLAHGDIKSANIRIAAAIPAGAYVFDWEMAGWGTPAPDLAFCEPQDIAAYAAASTDVGWPVPKDTQHFIPLLGRVLRYVAAVEWASRSLCYERVGVRPIRHLEVYHANLTALSDRLTQSRP